MRSSEHLEFHEPRTPGGGVSVLVVVSAISVVLAAFWVMGRDPHAATNIVARPPSQSSVPTPVDVEERTVYLWDTATGDFQDLFSGAGLSDPELSPDGERVVYEREGADDLSQIYLLDADGTEHRLTNLPEGAFEPTWSPDGSQIAFSATPTRAQGHGTDSDIFVMDADGSQVRWFARTAYDDAMPDWSPDGSRIAFHSESGDGAGMIWVASIDTRSNRRLRPLYDEWSAMDPAWSPDGRWIAYSRYHPGNTLNGMLYSAELWLARPDGSEKHRIGSRPPGGSWNLGMISRTPSWSPDGRLIAYEQDEWNGGRRRVNVIDVETGLARPFLSSTAGGWWIPFDPSWGGRGIVVIRPSADPILHSYPIPADFQPPILGGPAVFATITMTESRCELDRRQPIRPGRLTFELVNDSQFQAYFEVVRVRGTVGDLNEHSLASVAGSMTASLDPATARAWSTGVRIGPGRWAVVCHKDTDPSRTGFAITQVGVAGDLRVGSPGPG